MKKRLLWIVGGWCGITLLNVVLLPRKYAPHISVESLTLSPMPLIVRAAGNLEAKDSNTVKAQFEGPIVVKNFREGQAVQKGQLLAVIGRDKIRLDYQNRKDALINAEQDLTHSRHDLALQKQLFKKEAVAYSTVEDAKRALTKSEQGLRSAKEAFTLAQNQWNSSNVIAPISGTVVKDWVNEDKVIAAGKEIVTVADVSEYTVHAKVDELDVRQVVEGQKATVTVQIFAGHPLLAVVTQVGSQLDGNGLPEIPVVLRLLSTEGIDLRPKLTAESRIFTGTTDPTLSVPLTALVNNTGEPYVWVLNSVNRLKKRSVQMGHTNPERVEIVHGLSAGERVCITAEPDFADGMHAVLGGDFGATAASRTAKFLPPPSKDSANNKSPNSRRSKSLF